MSASHAPLLVEDILPVEHARQQQQREPEIRDRRRRRAVPFARQPEQQHGREDRQHHALPPLHRAHRLQALGRQRLRGSRVADRRRAQPVDDVGHDDQAHGARHRRRERPHRPRHLDARGLPRQLGDERVRRGRRQEHRRHDEIPLIERLHQERADPRGRRARLRSERPRDVQRDGKEDAAGARRVGRRHRRHDEIGEDDGVAEPERAPADAPDDGVGDALAERASRRTLARRETPRRSARP